MGAIEELAQFKTIYGFVCLFVLLSWPWLGVSLASLAQHLSTFSLFPQVWEGCVPVTWDRQIGIVFIRGITWCLTCSWSCILWYRFFRGQSQQLSVFWKVQCSESTLPLSVIALQLSAFRGESLYSWQLTANPSAVSSAGNNTSLCGQSHLG